MIKDKVISVILFVKCATHSTSEHRRGFECRGAPCSGLWVASDVTSQCFLLPDSSGINLPTPEGWMALLAIGAIEPSAVFIRTEPLTTTSPHSTRQGSP
ncbi:hypothetical protein Y032_0022g528 [Ancylostoma ceylanicum]|uniref:Uncharacterized protein n=1 Tax=Ancylostoma ceylanicum TaxID=53326 RepID=A0A016UYI1_9BILA|nr:hypothetical protein Y032_0022g528 [Ancylostoma ceylanicum]